MSIIECQDALEKVKRRAEGLRLATMAACDGQDAERNALVQLADDVIESLEELSEKLDEEKAEPEPKPRSKKPSGSDDYQRGWRDAVEYMATATAFRRPP